MAEQGDGQEGAAGREAEISDSAAGGKGAVGGGELQANASTL